MQELNIQPIIEAIRESVKLHEIEGRPGEYRRWLFQDEKGERGMDKNEYGCADAMNLLYTINDFYCDDETRRARIEALQSMQNPETGLFHEKTHHPYHTVAHCTAALQLFDVKPLYPIKEFHKYFDREELFRFLDEDTRWATNPWRDSHLGAGVYAALVNSDEITPEFSENYFEWFRENCDPVTGFWRRGVADKAPCYGAAMQVENKQAVLFQYMAAGFHYLFNHEYAKQPLPYPEKVIDSCIDLYTKNGLPNSFGMYCGFLEVDWVYCLTRALRQTKYRYDEGMACLEDFAVKFVGYMTKDNYTEYNRFNDIFQDLHCLFGTACCLAELQQTFPGKLKSDKPLKLVLDRRPFI